MGRVARVAWLVGLVTLLVAGCGGAGSREVAGGHRLVHVHEFPDMGARIAPPTGRPRLSWQQALQAVTRRHEGWPSRTPPQVKLADYSSRTGEGPTRPVLAWIVVYPDAEEVLFGPDFGPAAARGAGRCPAYVVVDATSGRGRGAFQTCEPPYRG
jgi:hypothetical protein